MKKYAFAEPSDGDVDKGWAVLAVCWAFVLCALMNTLLRAWLRLRLTKNFGSDDSIMVIAMVLEGISLVVRKLIC